LVAGTKMHQKSLRHRANMKSRAKRRGCVSRMDMTDTLVLPPNCVDRTAERVGTVMAIVGATAAGKAKPK
jgi:hypothetical protein